MISQRTTQPLTQEAIDAYRALTENPFDESRRLRDLPKEERDKPIKRRTLAQAIDAAQKRGSAPPSRTFSVFFTENVTRFRNGRRVGKIGIPRHNLTTDTASGYTNRRDHQSKAIGMGPSAAFATAKAAAVASTTITATTLTAATGFPTSGQGLQGQIVVVYGLANNSFVYGVIVSNTATVLTVDQWYDATSTSGAAATTPTTSGGSASTGIAYLILPGQNPASWLALTSDAVAPAATDTTLASEATTNGFARAVGTYSHTAAATTYLLSHLFTAAGSLTVNKEAVFGACNTTAGGVMPFESAEPTPPAMLSGDTLTQNVTITVN